MGDDEPQEVRIVTYVQTIDVRAEDEVRLRDHVTGWHAEQAGVAPGYRGARVLADRNAEDRFLILVDFTSEEEAARNDARPETGAWASRLGELTTGEPRFANHRLLCDTREDAR